jgi:hypothetical protein
MNIKEMNIKEVLQEMRAIAVSEGAIEGGVSHDIHYCVKAIERNMQEPVAWMSIDSNGNKDATLSEGTVRDWERFGRTIIPLYNTPPDQGAEIK